MSGFCPARPRPGAVLVNTARGVLVDQDALAEALASGRLAAAGLDVFAHEPVNPAHPLFALSNVVVAPHVAWLTGETWRRSLEVIVENVSRLAVPRPRSRRMDSSHEPLGVVACGSP